MALTTHAKFYSNRLMLTLIFGIWASEPPPWAWRSTEKAGPDRVNLDDEFCRPVLPHNQILCLHHFNLRSLCSRCLQSLSNWIQLHTSGTSAICTPFQKINNKNTFFCYSLLLGQFQLKLF